MLKMQCMSCQTRAPEMMLMAQGASHYSCFKIKFPCSWLRQIWEPNFTTPYMASKSLVSELFLLGGGRGGEGGMLMLCTVGAGFFV